MGCCKAKCIRGRATVAWHDLSVGRSSQQVVLIPRARAGATRLGDTIAASMKLIVRSELSTQELRLELCEGFSKN